MSETCRVDKAAAARIEMELRLAFGVADSTIDEKRVKLICDELHSYNPDNLQKALPYVLTGFLRFGVPSIDDRVVLGNVILFLDISGEPCDERYENRDSTKEMRRISQSKEETVSQFSSCQVHAIRLWLEAMRGFVGPFDGERLYRATAYWLEREQSPSEEQKRPRKTRRPKGKRYKRQKGTDVS